MYEANVTALPVHTRAKNNPLFTPIRHAFSVVQGHPWQSINQYFTKFLWLSACFQGFGLIHIGEFNLQPLLWKSGFANSDFFSGQPLFWKSVEKWFCKLAFFLWSTTFLLPEKRWISGIKPHFFLVNHFS